MAHEVGAAGRVWAVESRLESEAGFTMLRCVSVSG